MEVPKQCDVVVIGGGPAGAAVATLLSQKGYDVVLFEKQRHPRDQVGESIIPHIWKYLDAIGVTPQITAEGFLEKSGGVVAWGGSIREMRFADFGYTRPGLHVERDRFDAILLEHARGQGARVFEEVAALSADVGPGEEAVVTYRGVGDAEPGRIRCRYVADASGQNAVLGRQLNLRQVDDAFRFMALWGYFTGSKYIGEGGKILPPERIREIPPKTFVSSIDDLGEWGWLWHIPLRKTTSVGLVLPRDAMQAVKNDDRSLEEFFVRKCRAVAYVDQLLEDAEYTEGSFHVLRNYSYRSTRIAGPGFFLLGDAAGFVDPIYSIGVVFALYTSSVAAWAIDHALRDPASAARRRAHFTKLLAGRVEVYRSLALPRYGPVHASPLGREAVQFESALEQELMYVVSMFATRNENALEMISGHGGKPLTSEKYRVLSGMSA